MTGVQTCALPICDFGHFRCTARVIASESQKLGLGHFLSAVGSDSGESFTSLIRWAQHHHSTRGLELLCNQRHGLDRKMRRKECIRTVLKTQMVLLQMRGNCEESKCLILAGVCAKHSKHARRCASLMGIADAFAVSYSSLSSVPTFMGK